MSLQTTFFTTKYGENVAKSHLLSTKSQGNVFADLLCIKMLGKCCKMSPFPYGDSSPCTPPPPHLSIPPWFLGGLLYPIEEKICSHENFSDALWLFSIFYTPPWPFWAIFDNIKFVSLLAYSPLENITSHMYLVSNECRMHKVSKNHRGQRVWLTNFFLWSIFVPLPHIKMRKITKITCFNFSKLYKW